MIARELILRGITGTCKRESAGGKLPGDFVNALSIHHAAIIPFQFHILFVEPF